MAVAMPTSEEGPIVYTDGACLGNPGPGGWGVRLYFPNGTIQELGGSAVATTNNRMELQAAIEALKTIVGNARATVYTDSRYVIDGLTKWLPAWRRRGWITTAHTPVKNRDLWMTLDQHQHRGIIWRHVRGHSGDPDNERVDAIARAFASGKALPLFSGPYGSPLDPVQRQPTPTADGAGYISIVEGVPLWHTHWAECAVRVQGASGARYKKIRTTEELLNFCKQHGVPPPAR